MLQKFYATILFSILILRGIIHAQTQICNDSSKSDSAKFMGQSPVIHLNSNIGRVSYGCDLADSLFQDSNIVGSIIWASKRSEVIASLDNLKNLIGSIYLWNINTGKRRTIVPIPQDYILYGMKISHNEDYLFVGYHNLDHTILRCFSLKENKWMWMISDVDKFRCISFMTGDEFAILVGYKAIYKVEVKTGTIVKKITEIHKDNPRSHHKELWVYLSQNGKYYLIWNRQAVTALVDLFKAPANTCVNIWDIEKEEKVFSIPIPEGGAECGGFSLDEKYAFLGCNTQGLWVISLDSAKVMKKIEAKPFRILALNDNRIAITTLYYKDFSCDMKIANYITGEILENHQRIYQSGGFINTDQLIPFAFGNNNKNCMVERNGKMILYETEKWMPIWCVDENAGE